MIDWWSGKFVGIKQRRRAVATAEQFDLIVVNWFELGPRRTGLGLMSEDVHRFVFGYGGESEPLGERVILHRGGGGRVCDDDGPSNKERFAHFVVVGDGLRNNVATEDVAKIDVETQTGLFSRRHRQENAAHLYAASRTLHRLDHLQERGQRPKGHRFGPDD